MRKPSLGSCLPSGYTHIEFEKALGEPGTLKTSEYLLLAGPIGKYILEGSMHPLQQAAVFEYLDLIGSLWEKTITLERLEQLETDLPRVLTELEELLPSWELDINRHLMLHLVESIRANGPCWTWSMFGFERFWYRLLHWMTNKRSPEATIMNAFKSFTVASTALAATPASMIEGEQGSDPALQFVSSSVATPWYHLPRTFNESTFELDLPSYTKQHESTPIELLDGKEVYLSSNSQASKDEYKWIAELHLFYIEFPELCKKCTCPDSAVCTVHPSYTQLWRRFRSDLGQPEMPAKQHITGALSAWHVWAQEQEDLDDHQVSLCYGPLHFVRAYDRIIYGSVAIVATNQEGNKLARDSVVMLHNAGQYRAGRVSRFLTHTAPGCEPSLEDDVNIADVRLYDTVAADHQAAAASARDLKCPIFSRVLVDAPRGNLWPIVKLAPAKVWVVPHHSGRNHVMVLHSFASFRGLVPN